MKKSIGLKTFIFTFTIILSSCGGRNSSVVNSFNTTALLTEERILTSEERNIATRICYAYQSKSKNFRDSTYLGTHFLFSIKNTDCQNTVTTRKVDAVMNYDSSNQLSYTPTGAAIEPGFFYKTVMTDTSGYLSQLCGKIITNQPINNTVTESSTKVQISFFREGLDGFYIQYFLKQPDSTYKITSAEKFKVRSQIDYTNGQILGMDEYYSTQKLCASNLDKNKYSDLEQVFISH